MADAIEAASGDTDKAAQALASVQGDTHFWLGALARTIALQDRQSSSNWPGLLTRTRFQGVTIAREERFRRVVAGLESIAGAVTTSSRLSNTAKVANPFNAPKVARLANSITDAIMTLADHADLEIKLGNVKRTSWLGAARGLLGEASVAVAPTGTSVVERAQDVGRAVGDLRDESVLRHAERIAERRQQRAEIPDDQQEPSA